ncbi:MAG: ABC transporter permease [Planctomycetota bacterium]|nr:ABC transporter permease [Planctomycetota bacterium]
MYTLFLSLRFLKSRIISYLAVVFTMLGVSILIIVLCIMGGFETELQDSIRSFHSHLTVESRFFHNVRESEKIMEEAAKIEGVKSSAPFLTIPVFITGRTHDYGMLKGIDPALEKEVSKITEYILSDREIVWEIEMKEIREEEPEIAERMKNGLKLYSDEKDLVKLLNGTKTYRPALIVGSEIYKRFQLDPIPMGSPDIPPILTLMTARAMDITADKVEPLKQEFEVVGVFQTGNYEIDRRFMYCLIPDGLEFLEIEDGSLSGVAISAEDYEDVDRIKEALLPLITMLPDDRLVVSTWKDQNKALLQAVRLEKWLITVIIFFVLTLVSALIVAILTMSVVEKTRDIGILRALGASGRGVMLIFLSQGLFIGVLGAGLGFAVGLLIVANVNAIAAGIHSVTGYHPFPKDIYYLDKIPARIDLPELATLIGIVLIVSFLLSLLPAWRAVRVNTIRALRYE